MKKSRMKILSLVGILLPAMFLLAIMSAGVAGAATGGVSASGTNNAKITVTITDAGSDFGSNLDPEGTNSASTDTVLDYQGSTGNQGSYYVWKAAGAGVNVEVKSNKVWNGTVEATENGGTATSMTVASGVLKYAETTEPTTYSACDSGTAFATTAATWKSSVAKGANTYTYFYCLRVDWSDDVGTFSSSVTYTATQA